MDTSEYHEDLYVGTPLDRDYLDTDDSEDNFEPLDDSKKDERAFDDGCDPDNRSLDRTYEFGENGLAKPSIDVMIDHQAIIDNDGRSDTRTFFYPEDATYTSKERKDQYERLIRYQDGVGDPKRSIANSEADRQRLIDILTTQSALTPFQQERTRSIIDSLESLRFGVYSTEMVILGAITLAANEDGRAIRDEPQFIELTTDVGMDQMQLRRVRKKLRNRSPLY